MIKSWGDMDCHISVSLLVPIVFLDVVEVISSDDQGSIHFAGDHDALDELTSDAHLASERAFLVDEISGDSSLGGFETKPDVLPVPDALGTLLR